MRLSRPATLALCASLVFAQSVGADVISDWNAIAQANIGPGRPASLFGPTVPAGQVDLALVHLAMHDAVQAYDRRFETYSVPVQAAAGSAIVAAAKAAHDVLAARLSPTPAVVATIDAVYDAYIDGLSPAPSAEQISGGEQVGAAAASNVLTNRRFSTALSRFEDGSFPLLGSFNQFVGGTGLGEWRPNPGTAGMVAPWLGAVRPLAIATPLEVAPDSIPALTSLEYAESYNEVKNLGSQSSTLRTPEQSQVGRFFSGNPFAMYNRLLGELLAEHDNGSDLASLGNHARAFALMNMAAADAITTAWQCKVDFNFWRPIHGIQNGNDDGNPLTIGDGTWKPMLGTPNYPDYTSGFNNATGSMTQAMALYFGSDRPFDELRLWLTAPGVPAQLGDPNPRVYKRFSDVQKDVIDARIYLGIHFRFADTEARSQGKRIANYVFRQMLAPIRAY
jgi:hypothetical protein